MEEREPLRTGLLGGSFDPPTLAHLIAGEWAKEQLELDDLWYLPASKNPLKSGKNPTLPTLRLQMLRAALKSSPHRIEEWELDKRGDSFTVDTVEYLTERYPYRKFTLIVGLDAFHSMPRWKRIEDLVKLVEIAVMFRPHEASPDPSVLSDAKVHILDFPAIDISSTLVRERVAKGLSVRYLVTDEVLHIIEQHDLYHDPA